jgi:hypothetical protein
MVTTCGSRGIAALVRRADRVDQARERRVGGARGATAVSAPRQAWPSTAPGTPVFVEYFGWIFISGRSRCTAWATAIAASA